MTAKHTTHFPATISTEILAPHKYKNPICMLCPKPILDGQMVSKLWCREHYENGFSAHHADGLAHRWCAMMYDFSDDIGIPKEKEIQHVVQDTEYQDNLQVFYDNLR